MKITLFYLAVIGWILALAVFVSSASGIDVQEKYPYVWILQIGVFLVFVPAVVNLSRNEEYLKLKKTRPNSLSSHKVLLKGSPAWLNTIALIGFVFAFINGVLFFISATGATDAISNQELLQGHDAIKDATIDKFYFQTEEMRFFSAGWLASFGIAAALLYPYNKEKDEYNRKTSDYKSL